MTTITEFQLRHWLGDDAHDTSKLVSLLLDVVNERYTSKQLQEDVLSYNEGMSEEELTDAMIQRKETARHFIFKLIKQKIWKSMF